MSQPHHPDISARRMGLEGEPLVIIDDFHPDPERLRTIAEASSFGPAGVNYPGLRAPAPPEHLQDCKDVLAETLGAAFGFSMATLIATDFSLVTTPPDALTPVQRLPHFDGTHPRVIALLHYLSDVRAGGTLFYRHRSTGFETVTEERVDRYREVVEAEYRGAAPNPVYFSGSDDHFEQIDHVPAKFNRAVLYRGVTLHSGEIPDAQALTSDPREGRLTVNTFLAPRRAYGGWRAGGPGGRRAR